MASPFFSPPLFIIFFLFHLTLAQAVLGAGGGLIFEDGYTVNTVLDGDKSNVIVNPHAIIHQSPPSDLFILLDSSASTFYTVSLPTASNNTVIQRLAGNGEPTYIDGDLGSATFNKPRSFAVDYKGNVYVADHRNHAIRKITKSGVTTIAGGFSQKAGRTDGPARDASFSNDFELTFIPERCALMISDHGNRLVRQINLKAEDCTKHSASGRLQATSSHLDMDTLANESGETNGDALLRRQKQSRTTPVKSVSLLDLDDSSSSSSNTSNMVISPTVDNQLKDLLTFDGGLMLPVNVNEVVEQKKERESSYVISSGDGRNIDGMILANLVNFEEEASRVYSEGSVEYGSGLIKRR
ncbi:hypothetical protein BUALT_Bualt17G0049500 [Buddleja alternifolia]|uniref:NHL repeat-containing protein n=1 Tax=Buddleja alternifolia TaxID=168488 RepID=A0AAV6WCJ3_9LAMI|nr:hypothetical protein BUALT_Bualt17G0049500 [Buddleja alternifolia]